MRRLGLLLLRLTLILSISGGSLLSPIQQPASAQLEEATVVALGLALLAEIKDAIKSYGTAIVYAKAKTDGPDADDKSVDFEFDRDLGLDWDLEAEASVLAENSTDDPPLEPEYIPNPFHSASAHIHYKSSNGQWKPAPIAPGIIDEEYIGYASAVRQDDRWPTGMTEAAAVAAFSADGKSSDFCYGAEAKVTATEEFSSRNMKQVKCSPTRQFRLIQGGILLADTNTFVFEELGEGLVRITPKITDIDLFHTYLQQRTNREVFLTLRGHEGDMEELARDFYEERIVDTNWVLTEDPARRADLTVVGAALHLGTLELARDGRTDVQLLDSYFGSLAVSVIAPEHAQKKYKPKVGLRAVVHTGQDISGIIGREFVIHANAPPGMAEVEGLVGVLISVTGTLNQAVARGLATKGHFVWKTALTASGGEPGPFTFVLRAMNFHHEAVAAGIGMQVGLPFPG